VYTFKGKKNERTELVYEIGHVGEGGRHVAAKVTDSVGYTGFNGSSLHIQHCWSADGRRIAWAWGQDGWASTRGLFPGEDHVALMPTGIWIQVLANADIADAVLPKLATQLEQRGYAPKVKGASQKHRDTSVIYAAEGFESQAAQIAALVPGGATVAPLTWKTQAQLVVAVGASGAPR